MLTTILAGTVSAVIISPNDDAYIDETQQGTTHDAPTLAAAGVFMKNQTNFRRAGFMEYTIPNVTASAATFNATYFRSQTGGSTGAWTFRLSGTTTAAAFDETILTWTNANASGGINSASFTYGQIGSDVALSGGNGTGTGGQLQDVVPNVPVVIDILTYFNAHQGQTIVFKLNSVSSSGSSTAGGTFQDREQSRSMTANNGPPGAVPDAPFISYVPEPATALLLAGGLLMLRRRRTAGR